MKKLILCLLSAFVLTSVTALSQSADINTPLLRAVAALHSSNGREAAHEALKKLASDHPDNDAVHFYLGKAELMAKNTKSAVREFEEALRLSPDNNEYRETLAQVYATAGEDSKSADLYLDLVKRDPSRYRNAFTLTILGDRYLYERKDSLALDCYDKALLYDPEYAPALLGKSEIYRTRGNLAPFFVLTDKFASDPTINPKAKCQYIRNILKRIDARTYHSWSAQIDSVVSHCADAHPTDSSALMLAGEWFYATGKKEAGERYFEKFITLFQNNDESDMLKLDLMASKNDLDGMIGFCREILKRKNLRQETELKVLVTLGDCLHQKGDYKECWKAYDKALKINPEHIPLLNNYAYFLCIKGKNLKKALKMSKVTVDKEPDNPTYLDTYGWILHLMGRDTEAKACFKHAIIYGGKDSKEILFHYASVLYSLGENELASYYKSLAEDKK